MADNDAGDGEQKSEKIDPRYKELIDPLRNEVVESEKARIDFLKYKLIAVAALGSIGLGLNKTTDGSLQYAFILCFIPLVCLYVDLLCYHNTLRILVIGKFFSRMDCPYENFISETGKVLQKNGRSGSGYLFELEDGVLKGSTFFLSSALSFIGIVWIIGLVWIGKKEWLILVGKKEWLIQLINCMALVLSGFVGISFSCIFKKKYEDRKAALFASADMLSAYYINKNIKGLSMTIIHNQAVSELLQDSYSLRDIQNIFQLLVRHKTLTFPALPNGLFPAANLEAKSLYTGYSNVWVRDNIYVAYAHYLNGETETALKTINTLAEYFLKHKWRFEKIISGELDYHDPMNRPHIRFIGEDLSEMSQKWAHAENDALGYFIWLLCKIHNEMGISLKEDKRQLLTLFTLYLKTIHYWEDEDSGHWEEARKIEASSIGVVVRGLKEFKGILPRDGAGFQCPEGVVTAELLENLIDRGLNSLHQILPAECNQPDPHKNRRFDAALLFLIFPMDIVPEEMADQILRDVTSHLQGEYGICRYLGDSFWAADYKDKLRPEERTIDFSDSMANRDRFLKEGEEAQWCIFDSIISIIYGLKYKKYRRNEFLKLQTHYFNRALGQVTGEEIAFGPFKCPELYYLEKGQFVPNDTVPLLWTQANLWMALKFMKESFLI